MAVPGTRDAICVLLFVMKEIRPTYEYQLHICSKIELVEDLDNIPVFGTHIIVRFEGIVPDSLV